ncbi:SRPBCC domain-containing protein [bacterium]|nr:SRPBCC domain-containing protein [candidate division CSSED10-310 bacterium]
MDSVTLKPIVKECIVRAPRTDVWRAFTTSEGAMRFFAPAARIELRLDGSYEIYMDMHARPGYRGSEGCRVLSFLDGEMLSFTWNAPPAFPEIRTERTYVVIQFSDAENRWTHVKLTHAGWRSGGDWPKVHAYFDRAWEIVLHNLREKIVHCCCETECSEDSLTGD